MSTKNLARTIIEGGRYRGATWSCRYGNGVRRANTRIALAGVAAGADADEMVVRQPQKIGRRFRDKLSASERWLDAQVGRPWNLVRSDLLRTFDTRTTAGRHIVFDHMLPSVRGEGSFDWAARFAVDRHGLLRRLPKVRYWHRAVPAPLPRSEREIAAWLSGRRVGARGDALFWFTPTAGSGYRQHHRLGGDDAVLWRSLPDWFRRCHDPFAASAANPTHV
jgi:hypothetical protein